MNIFRKKMLTVMGLVTLISCGVREETSQLQQAGSIPSNINNAGFKVLGQLVKEKESENAFISPYSIHSFMSMMALGSEGQTEAELKSFLGYQDASDLMRSHRDLSFELRRSAVDFDLKISNSLWTGKTFDVEKSYLNDVNLGFNAAVEKVDFADQAGTAGLINDWASRATLGVIKKIITPEKVDPYTILFLANATYFHADWTQPFNVGITYKREFTKQDGSVVEVPFLRSTAHHNYLETNQYEAIVRRYGQGASAAMIVIKPKGNVNDLVTSLDAQKWSRLSSSLLATQPQLGSFEMPKLKFNAERELQDALKNLGVSSVFENRQELSKISAQDSYLSYVKHDSYLAVDEKGTTAAAITSGGAVAASAGPRLAYEFVADKPYLLAIVHLSTNTVLFTGVIHNPE